jgi:hypothetical protein
MECIQFNGLHVLIGITINEPILIIAAGKQKYEMESIFFCRQKFVCFLPILKKLLNPPVM